LGGQKEKKKDYSKEFSVMLGGYTYKSPEGTQNGGSKIRKAEGITGKRASAVRMA